MTCTPSVASCHQRMCGRRLMNDTSRVICTSSTATIDPEDDPEHDVGGGVVGLVAAPFGDPAHDDRR